MLNTKLPSEVTLFLLQSYKIIEKKESRNKDKILNTEKNNL